MKTSGQSVSQSSSLLALCMLLSCSSYEHPSVLSSLINIQGRKFCLDDFKEENPAWTNFR